MRKKSVLCFIAALILMIAVIGCAQTQNPTTYSMKGVGIHLPQQDFIEMQKAGIKVISTEWGMEEPVNDARSFLDQAYAAGLYVVMDGGFSARAWGFTENDWDNLPAGKHPVWQKEKVQKWINSLKDHPAIIAWDICNEFGENLPSGAGVANSDWPEGRITTDQLLQAKADVMEADPTRPIHVRAYSWDCEHTPSYIRGLLDNHIADIISLNIYSNYLENGKLQWPEAVKEGGPCCVEAIKNKTPDTVIWVSIAAFEDSNIFKKPTTAALKRDIRDVHALSDINGISFFCWGPVNQWDPKNDWYLPESGADLWKIIKDSIAEYKTAGRQ